MITATKRSDFAISKSDIVQDLNRLIRFEKGQQASANTLPELAKTLALTALGATIKYLDLAADSCNLGHFQIKLLNLNRYNIIYFE